MDTLRFGDILLSTTGDGRHLRLAHVLRPDRPLRILPPVFQVHGAPRTGFRFVSVGERQPLAHGGEERTMYFRCVDEPCLRIAVTVRSFPGSPVVRFKQTLSSVEPVRLAPGGDQQPRYLVAEGWSSAATLTEIQLSHFDPVVHSYLPGMRELPAAERYDGQALTGPILTVEDNGMAMLLAYEHGADYPGGFLRFVLGEGATPGATLEGVQGNYCTGAPISPEDSFESVWFQIAVMPGDRDALLRRYRAFVLDEMCERGESRRPYIYYNTWNYQERQRYFHGAPYLASMGEERMLAEIDAAHRIGIDVFVIDTGWFAKTGDWEVSAERFPRGLAPIREALEERGMLLGLWMNPIVAARSSEAYRMHPEFAMTRDGEPVCVGPVWETEESFALCLASGYEAWLVERMVRMRDELGVRCFKWDGVGQWGCDSDEHNHGGSSCVPGETAACYAFEMGRAMTRVAAEVARRRPDTTVDFDVTEAGRYMGLGFLSAGRYFLVNNGPYFSDLDVPASTRIEPNTINVLFNPGPARSRVCRTGARYDGILPANLFLTHYLPDGPALSQQNAVASLALGGGGIWGDLPALDEADVARLRAMVDDYRRVAGAAARAYPRVRGFAGSSPEVHEKVDASSGQGLVALFTVEPCVVTHVTPPLAACPQAGVRGADSWELLPDGRLRITVALERNGARLVCIS